MRIVSNTSPLIFLTKIRRLDFLKGYDITIPQHVLEEINEWGKIDAESHLILTNWIKKNKIVIKKSDTLGGLPSSLGKGEKAAISLAVKEGVKAILADEKKARIIAKLFGLAPKGTFAVILQQAFYKKITKADCKNLVLELVKKGYRIKEELLAEFLQQLETPEREK